jgi:hypothetical protein
VSGWLLAACGLALPLLVGCGYRVGHPPHGVGLRPGEVQVPVSEPAVGDALEHALGAAIRRQGAAGDRAVDVRVERAVCEPAASRSGTVALWSAELSATFTLLGAAPRTLSLQRGSTFASPQAGDLPAARAQAFEELATALADEAVSLFLYAPPGGATSGGEP